MGDDNTNTKIYVVYIKTEEKNNNNFLKWNIKL